MEAIVKAVDVYRSDQTQANYDAAVVAVEEVLCAIDHPSDEQESDCSTVENHT